MKLLQLNFSDVAGGAARAAFRSHKALRQAGVDSKMFVNNAQSGDWSVISTSNKFSMVYNLVRPYLVKPLRDSLKTNNKIIHSPSLIPTNLHKYINASNADIVHLHWVQGEMISIDDIARISKPIVWTMHDMWPFCGAEHYTTDHRWRDGYKPSNRPEHESGLDLNRIVWEKKKNKLKKPLTMIANCSWISDCASSSNLMNQWPIFTIPNPIDIEVWRPHDKLLARQLFGLPSNKSLCLFSSLSGINDERKGIDLLVKSLEALSQTDWTDKLEIVILANEPKTLPSYLKNIKFKIHFAGLLRDNLTLSLLYSAVDIVAIPSRQETLTNVGVEAQACGCPVLAFRSTGLLDIVIHGVTGYLADPFDIRDFAKGITSLLSLGEDNMSNFKADARSRSTQLWSNQVISEKLINLYSETLSCNPRSDFS